MEALWNRGASSVRELQEALPEKDRPAYTTVQTHVYRLEPRRRSGASKKIGNAHIFEAVTLTDAAHRRIVDDCSVSSAARRNRSSPS